MRRLRGLCALAAVLGVGGIAAGAPAEPRVVMISVDGLMPAYWLRADELGLRVPNLRKLMADGAYARVTGVLPTVTYPSHTTLITGVPPRKHGIGANTYFDPQEKAAGAWRWYADEVLVPTLVSAAREKRVSTGAVSWPVSVGRFADDNVPEYFRPGSEHASDVRLVEALATPGLVKAAARARGRAFAWPLTDDDRTDLAVHVLKTRKPRLMLLHIFEVDDQEHDFGPMTPEAKAAVEKSDAHIGQVLQALDAAGTRAETLVAIVSDHGFLPVAKTIRPNTLLREAGLIDLDEKGKVKAWRAIFHSSGGSAALHLAADAPAGTLARVKELLGPRLADPESGLRDVLDAAAVERLGGVDVPLVLNAREGYSISHTSAGEWHVPPTSKGAHGHAPDREEVQASLLLAGPGVRSKGDLGVVSMTQVAPTLARVLGLTLHPEAGTPLP
jgi:predicted AlkP superfamily pyrophosphatase or phosphodiesterase